MKDFENLTVTHPVNKTATLDVGDGICSVQLQLSLCVALNILIRTCQLSDENVEEDNDN